MTNEQAIRQLKLIKSTAYLGNRKFYEALNKAIEALRAQNLHSACTEVVQDTVSRQDLIASFKLDDDGTAWSMDEIIYRLEQFPSAEPEVIRCKDCRHNSNCEI